MSLGLFLGGNMPRGAVAPADPAPTITSTNSASVAENAALSKALTADESVTWSISGGADQAQFEISGSTLRWSSNGTRNFEVPADANTDNAYIVTVRATDSGNNTTDQTITVSVTDVDDTAPTITSTNTASVAENATLSKSLTADESVTWSLNGGADAAQFEISGSTLRWSSNGTRDFEAPADADVNNAYVVTVRATDTANNTADQTVTVTVTDVFEATSFDGATVLHTTLSNGNLTTDHDNTTLGGARGAHAKNSGKYYFEVVSTVFNSGDAYGICTVGATYVNVVTNGSNGGFIYATGAAWSNNANTLVDIGSPGSAVRLCFAVDLDNEKWWARVAGGEWCGSAASHNPETNTGGFSLSNYTATTLMPVVGFSTTATSLATFNFGATAFTHAVPSGFTSGWPT